ncbi:hypothetical protein C8R47DRAFT_725303 [Mycena vitilis]|nr:hypothetical protein C8R47DRAFT_725303 [Mycena vitilis]
MLSGPAADRALDRARILDLDSQISALEETVLLLKNRRQSVQARLDAYTYPVLTLPNEIVSRIFENFLPLYPLCPPSLGLLSPVVLGQICHKWRDIAFMTPTLWKAISFIAPDTESRSHWHWETLVKATVELLETSLARSGACPLSIQWHLAEDYFGSRLPKILLIMARHFGHMEHLNLCCPLPGRLPPLHVQYPMPILRSLDLTCDDETYIREQIMATAHPPPITAFLDTPRLQSVHLRRLTHSSGISLPWHQLTTLFLDSKNPECVKILNHAINLVHCTLFLDCRNAVDSNQIPPLTRLQSLEIFGDSTGLLQLLTLPALLNVHVARCHAFVNLEFMDDILSCIARSGCNLQQLHIIKGRKSPLTPDLCRTKFPFIQTLLLDEDENF